MKYTTKYFPPILTIDLSYFEVQNGKLCVLLLKRPNHPFMGVWALPGGYVPRGETTREALDRIVEYKTGVNVDTFGYLEQSHAFDVVAHDPRGHAVSVAYVGAGINTKTEKTPEEVAFFAIDKLPKLAFDHQKIIDFARQKMVDEVNHTNLIRVFLPDLFTMGDLQKAYEAVLGRPLDKRNFQKKFFKLDQIAETGKLRHNTNSRPAKLYKFKTKTIEHLVDSLD